MAPIKWLIFVLWKRPFSFATHILPHADTRACTPETRTGTQGRSKPFTDTATTRALIRTTHNRPPTRVAHFDSTRTPRVPPAHTHTTHKKTHSPTCCLIPYCHRSAFPHRKFVTRIEQIFTRHMSIVPRITEERGRAPQKLCHATQFRFSILPHLKQFRRVCSSRSSTQNRQHDVSMQVRY